MGGRGSGGGRSGGGGGSSISSKDIISNSAINNYGINNRAFVSEIQDKLKGMSDTQINNQYHATKKLVNKALNEYKQERNKLEKINKEFDKTKEGTPQYYKKMREMDQQIKRVQIAQQYSNMRHQAHYLVINERSNVRKLD